ncbi:MAG TPA: DUF4349 domain-containing protein [Saprospiraceae bacterium]|nr:DUF4349 domain-containing protein [Saprospiraceae bacterium]MCC6689339.1 DUF4349 domain-containing protein [Saprospiraceae bacterium]HMV24829.1 DUF4349 domain-containing protein [Saprospiraceae bacterium]HMX83814.1 DUF4349 domain-containing protein [Saprospiraceae bacterium]HMX86558.1 DUF4349 domain-containing protein [Saprospiraceae bacterium]
MKNLLPFFLLLMMACQQKNDSEMAENQAFAAPEEKSGIAGKPPADMTIPEQAADRKLVKEGDISMEVKDLQTTGDELKKLTATYKAYLSNESQSAYDDRKQISYIVRIPVKDYEAFCENVISLGVNIERKNLNALDVTEEYVDTEARIATKKALEKRYLELLAKAKNVNEMLSIERELATVREEIESREARLKLLNNQSSYSTLNLTIYEIVNQSPGFVRSAGQALAGGWFAMIKFALFLLRIWPFVLILAVVLYFGKKRFRPLKK